MNSPEYKISSIADFLKVPAEKQAECVRDFVTWLNMARDAAEIGDLMTEILQGKVSFGLESFTWIDDGVSGCSAIDVTEEGGPRSVRLDIGMEKNP